VNAAAGRNGKRKASCFKKLLRLTGSAASQMLTDLAERLAQRGCRVVVITGQLLYSGRQRVLPAFQEIAGVEVHRVWTTSFGRASRGRVFDYLSFYAMSALAVLRIARRGDVVVAKTDPPMLSITLLAPVKIRRACLVNWLQDIFPEVLEAVSGRNIPPVAIRMLRGIRNISLKASRANVAIGQRMKSFLVSQGLPPVGNHCNPELGRREFNPAGTPTRQSTAPGLETSRGIRRGLFREPRKSP
jgi:hypothetical protein